jgi:hypothetical protein
MKKAQAGLDFLMTYGWALLLVVLVVGALFALGIFDVGSFLGSKASGFSQLSLVGWRLAESGSFTVMFENHAGTGVNVTAINATLGTDTISYSTAFTMSTGSKSGTKTVGTFSNPGTSGDSYTVDLVVTYVDTSTGFQYVDSGTLTGRVS